VSANRHAVRWDATGDFGRPRLTTASKIYFWASDKPYIGRGRFQKEFSMSKFAIGEQVDNAADDHEAGTVIAVFPTVDGNFNYAVDMEGYGTLRFFTEEKLVVHSN
jgi:hypothetical protein